MARLVAKAIEDKPAMGIALMLLTYLCFSFIDTSAKWLALAGLSAFQLSFMRYFGHFAISLGRIAKGGISRDRFATSHFWLVMLRGGSARRIDGPQFHCPSVYSPDPYLDHPVFFADHHLRPFGTDAGRESRDMALDGNRYRVHRHFDCDHGPLMRPFTGRYCCRCSMRLPLHCIRS